VNVYTYVAYLVTLWIVKNGFQLPEAAVLLHISDEFDGGFFVSHQPKCLYW